MKYIKRIKKRKKIIILEYLNNNIDYKYKFEYITRLKVKIGINIIFKNKPRVEKFILPLTSICGGKFDIGVP